ncbi:DNA adenine methylase [Acetobacter senegalensis]|uniref:DNA adenine methylase n=1 Tax=Acetobacter TaxID=434 RepID=UPI000A382551|nr:MULTISPECIES: DNA adenine methylase [Acetobacter]MCP1197262.1 DNA adenine methylase [Acetobacter senegalensis]
MKYMGSKRAMLGNGLGDALRQAVSDADRVFDLFTGSAAVAWHVAQRFDKEVIAGDLQLYSTVIAGAVIERTEAVTSLKWADNWFGRAHNMLTSYSWWNALQAHQAKLASTGAAEASQEAQSFELGDRFSISSAYGGYYFSPWQSAWIDALRKTLPSDRGHRAIALASLIQAASRCAASPGHTAQPFKPNETAGPYLLEAWRKDLPAVVAERIKDIAPRHAMKKGQAHCMDAVELAKSAKQGDLAFLDPPYSGVHYSRFYHVLESVAQGVVGPVEGVGRYPHQDQRPSSDFSMSSRSRAAFDQLLAILAERRASVIITFPAGKASNGLAGDDVKALASSHFNIEEEKVSSRFSTLGGDMKHRAARKDAFELILKLSNPS